MTNQLPKINDPSRDYDSLMSAMLELARERLPEWTDHSPNDFGVTLLELFAAMVDRNFYALDRVASESYLETAQERRSVVNLLRLIGYELRPPLPAYAALTLAFPLDKLPQDGLVTIPQGCRFFTTMKSAGAVIGFRYMRPTLVINFGALPTTTIGGNPFKVYKPLQVVQVDFVVTNEEVGSSDGSPRQRWPLAKTPLIDGSLEVCVGDDSWTQRPSLLNSGPGDKHFSVHRDETGVAWLEFGDGNRGMVPPRGRKNIVASYCAGGGVKGNVPALSICETDLQVDNTKPKVYNEAPGNRGTEGEPIAEAVERAPWLYRSMGRAVSASDYEAHALAFGAAKARARAIGNMVEVRVAPAGGGTPTDIFIDDLEAYLEPRRMLTTSIKIAVPSYVELDIKLTVTAEPFYYNSEIQARVRAATKDLWAFDRVDFGETLYVSKIYEAVEAVEGVAGVVVTSFSRKGGSNQTSGKIVLEVEELPAYLGIPDSNITVQGGK